MLARLVRFGRLARFDRHVDGSYNQMSQVDSPDEAILDDYVVGEIRRLFARFLSHVTYYQQTGGLHEQVATAPLGGVTIHGRSQRVARSQDRRRGVHRADGHLTVTSYFLYSAYAAADAKLAVATEEAANKAQAASPPSTSMKKCEERSAPRPPSIDPAKEEIGAHFKKIDQRLDGMINAVNTAVYEGPGRRGPGDRA